MSTRDLDRLADEDLLVEIRRGDTDAFDVLYQRHARVLYSLAYRLLGDREAAEDLVQEALLAAWRSAASYVPARGSVRAWLLTILRNRGIDILRAWDTRSRRDQALASESRVESASVDTEGEWLDRSMKGMIRREVGDLPEQQALVVSLAYYGGFSHHEISDMLDLPLGTVKSRMRLALERLRRGIIGDEVAR